MKTLLTVGLMLAFVLVTFAMLCLFWVSWLIALPAIILWYYVGPELVVNLNERIESIDPR